MVLPNSSYPNASLFGQNRGAQSWTNESGPINYLLKVSNMVTMNLQIMGSQLAGIFMTDPDTATGDMFGYKTVDPVSAVTDTTRYPVTMLKAMYDALIAASVDISGFASYYSEPTAKIRWAFRQMTKYRPILNPDIDQFMAEVSLNSRHVQNGLMAIGRQEDQIIMDALLGPAVEGMVRPGQSQTSIAWAPDVAGTNGMTLIPVDGVGLTDTKINAVCAHFLNKGVPPQSLVAIISAMQLKDFMTTSDINTFHLSKDYVNAQPMMNYAIPDGYMGVGKWVVIGNDPGVTTENSVIKKTGSTRRCVFATRNAMAVTPRRTLGPKLYEKEELDDAVVASMKSFIGGVRLEEKRVVEVHCME